QAASCRDRVATFDRSSLVLFFLTMLNARLLDDAKREAQRQGAEREDLRSKTKCESKRLFRRIPNSSQNHAPHLGLVSRPWPKMLGALRYLASADCLGHRRNSRHRGRMDDLADGRNSAPANEAERAVLHPGAKLATTWRI